MYLLLKCHNKLKTHPITQRLYQYRQLLSKIEPVFDDIIKPQIDLLMEQEALENVSYCQYFVGAVVRNVCFREWRPKKIRWNRTKRGPWNCCPNYKHLGKERLMMITKLAKGLSFRVRKRTGKRSLFSRKIQNQMGTWPKRAQNQSRIMKVHD